MVSYYPRNKPTTNAEAMSFGKTDIVLNSSLLCLEYFKKILKISKKI